jgi:hypothetical protein
MPIKFIKSNVTRHKPVVYYNETPGPYGTQQSYSTKPQQNAPPPTTPEPTTPPPTTPEPVPTAPETTTPVPSTPTPTQVIKFSRTTTAGNWTIATENYNENLLLKYNFTKQLNSTYSLTN